MKAEQGVFRIILGQKNPTFHHNFVYTMVMMSLLCNVWGAALFILTLSQTHLHVLVVETHLQGTKQCPWKTADEDKQMSSAQMRSFPPLHALESFASDGFK